MTVGAKFVFKSKAQSNTFWKIAHKAVCHISASLNINFDCKKGSKKIAICRKCKLHKN